MLDIVVVGGGPAGLFAALRLAEAGLDVALLEEHDTIGVPTHCTGILSLEAFELFKIPASAVLNRLSLARLVSPAGRAVRLPWDRAEQEEIFVVDRALLDQAIAQEAEKAGVEVRTGRRAEALSVGPGGVEVTDRAGATVRARACVLASGVSYRFQRRLGLGLPAQFLHSAQVEVDAAAGEAVDLYFGREVAPDGFAWAVPVWREDRSRLKLGVMARGDAGGHLARFLERPEIRARLDGAPGTPVRRLLPLGPLPKTYAERVLVVGDAAGLVKPTTGGGIFYSLLSAALAAETLVEAIQDGDLGEPRLRAYERRWQDRLGAELRVSGWLRQVVTRCSDEEIDTLLGALGAEDVRAVIRESARFNWHRELIVALLSQRGVMPLLLRSLFR